MATTVKTANENARQATRGLLAGTTLHAIGIAAKACGEWAGIVETLDLALATGGVAKVKQVFNVTEKTDARLRALVTNDEMSLTNVTLAEIREHFGNVSWAWQSWIPTGHLTLIAGVTGIGKSFLAAGLIAALSGARTFPDGSRPAHMGRVLLAETEEFRGAYAERLAAMGVQDEDVRFPAPGGDLTYLPNLATDAPLLTSIAQSQGCVALVVDSLSGGHSLDENSAEMRAVLLTLAQIASLLNIPILVVHHLRKRSSFEPTAATLDRVRGSSAIPQFCRSVLGLWKPNDDDDAVRVESLKCSFAARPEPFGFQATTGGLVFCDAPEEPRTETVRDRAVEFLHVELRKEPQKFADLLAKAEAQGISQRTLYRARDALHVVAVKGMWSLAVKDEDPGFDEIPKGAPS